MNKLLKLSAIALLLLAAGTAKAQVVGIKTNVIYWAAGGTLNLGAEVAVAPKITLDIGATGNPWYFGKKERNRKIWHWTLNGEARFWLYEKFHGPFFGVHMLGGAFDAGGITLPGGILPGLNNNRYEGWTMGVGVSAGWQWYLAPHWNLEATLGFGYMFVNYNKFGCGVCDQMVENNAIDHYFGPTKVGVSFMYLFGSKK